MDIVLCTDNNYAMPCGVTIVSVLENNKEHLINVHIVGTDLEEGSKKELYSISDRYSNASIYIYDIKESFLRSHQYTASEMQHKSISAYARLFLGNILPKDLDKVIYLDCDVIICDSLSELWSTNIDAYSIIAVPDLYIQERMPELVQNLGYDSSYGYINSGVLVINLKYWREHNLIDVFLSFCKEKSDKTTYLDQDVINGTLYDTKLFLPINYNVQDPYFLRKTKLKEREDDILAALIDPIIIHFTSSTKPWMKSSYHPMKGEFLKYKSLSPWKDTPLTWGKMTTRDIIKHYQERISRALGFRNKKYLSLNKLRQQA